MTRTVTRSKFAPEPDFVIVGGSAAGGVMAEELSTAGFRVVVLEQGPYIRPDEFTHDEIKSNFESALVNANKLQPNTFRKTEQETAKLNPCVGYGRMVDGGTVHFTGNAWGFHEIDFMERGKKRKHRLHRFCRLHFLAKETSKRSFALRRSLNCFNLDSWNERLDVRGRDSSLEFRKAVGSAAGCGEPQRLFSPQSVDCGAGETCECGIAATDAGNRFEVGWLREPKSPPGFFFPHESIRTESNSTTSGTIL